MWIVIEKLFINFNLRGNCFVAADAAACLCYGRTIAFIHHLLPQKIRFYPLTHTHNAFWHAFSASLFTSHRLINTMGLWARDRFSVHTADEMKWQSDKCDKTPHQFRSFLFVWMTRTPHIFREVIRAFTFDPNTFVERKIRMNNAEKRSKLFRLICISFAMVSDDDKCHHNSVFLFYCSTRIRMRCANE